MTVHPALTGMGSVFPDLMVRDPWCAPCYQQRITNTAFLIVGGTSVCWFHADQALEKQAGDFK